MPIDRTPAHHWELMREYHYERWKALDRFWWQFVIKGSRNWQSGGLLTSPDPPPLFQECRHHAMQENLAANKWRSMQAKAKRRREKQCAS